MLLAVVHLCLDGVATAPARHWQPTWYASFELVAPLAATHRMDSA